MHPETHASTEPQSTLYTRQWCAGRDRAGRIISHPVRATFVTLLDTMERGWRIIRPLQAAAERWRWDQSLSRTQKAVAGFVDIEICDLYRTVAWDCAGMVPGPSRYEDVQVFEDTEAEIEVVLRNLTVAALGAEHPDFPEPFRLGARDSADAFELWLKSLKPVLSRALDVVGQVQRGMTMPRLKRKPKVRGAPG